MKIGRYEIGPSVFFIAEIGSNHNGDFSLAKELVVAAARSGASAVKFQTYRAEKLVRPDVPALAHVRAQYKTQLERFRSLEFAPAQWRELAELARREGSEFFSSAFDEASADMLDDFVPAYKIASGDLTNKPLIRSLVKRNKPLILSTGMATPDEIAEAIKDIPSDRLVLLHCVSLYPTPIEKANLLSIPHLRDRFGVPIGYSDHTLGVAACLGAVALGALVIEKHFTLDKNQTIGDHKLSAEPSEFKRLVEEGSLVQKALGEYGKPLSDGDARKPMRRSLVATRDLPAGTRLTMDMMIPLRPGDGIAPSRIDEVIGRVLTAGVKGGEPLRDEHLSDRAPSA
ncbi:MAG: N-acetylneuraminate synthase family protein [Desulfomonile tiedjei]|nr:N-acetylneuraminate synthase family protein [Desulfomonile tiedjei]